MVVDDESRCGCLVVARCGGGGVQALARIGHQFGIRLRLGNAGNARGAAQLFLALHVFGRKGKGLAHRIGLEEIDAHLVGRLSAVGDKPAHVAQFVYHVHIVVGRTVEGHTDVFGVHVTLAFSVVAGYIDVVAAQSLGRLGREVEGLAVLHHEGVTLLAFQFAEAGQQRGGCPFARNQRRSAEFAHARCVRGAVEDDVGQLVAVGRDAGGGAIGRDAFHQIAQSAHLSTVTVEGECLQESIAADHEAVNEDHFLRALHHLLRPLHLSQVGLHLCGGLLQAFEAGQFAFQQGACFAPAVLLHQFVNGGRCRGRSGGFLLCQSGSCHEARAQE